MRFYSFLAPCLGITIQVQAWVVTSYYKTSVTMVPNPFDIGESALESSIVTIPVFPTAAVSTISVSTITDMGPNGTPYLMVVEVFVPSDAPATTTTTAPFVCDQSGINTCTESPTTAVQTEYIAYLTMTAPSYCSSTFSFVATTRLDNIYDVPDEATSQVLASATYKTTYLSEKLDDHGFTATYTYVDVYVPTDLYTATTIDEISSLISQCIDPRAGVDQFLAMSTMTCTPGPDGPATGCPAPILTAAASTTGNFASSILNGLSSAISSAEASATGGGKKSDGGRSVGRGDHWVIMAVLLLASFLAGVFIL